MENLLTTDYGLIGILILVLVKFAQSQKEENTALENRQQALFESIREDMKSDKETMVQNGIKRTKEHKEDVKELREFYELEMKTLNERMEKRESEYREDLTDFKKLTYEYTNSIKSIDNRMDRIENLITNMKGLNLDETKYTECAVGTNTTMGKK